MNLSSQHPYENETASVPLGGRAYGANLLSQKTARRLALGATAGVILFNLAWLVLGFVSPGFTIFGTWVSPYSPVSQPISGLGLGVTAPFMNAAFVLGGLFVVAGTVGIFQSIPEISTARRWISTLLLALIGVGMVVDGIFTLEAMMPHMAGFLMAAGTPVVSFPVIGMTLRCIPRWRRVGRWLLAAGPVTLVLLVLALVTFDPVASGAGLGIAGLTQRILVIEFLFWVAVLGWKAFRGS